MNHCDLFSQRLVQKVVTDITCFSYKNIEQKILSRGTKVIPFLFTLLNQTKKNICGRSHAMQVLLMKQKDTFQV